MAEAGPVPWWERRAYLALLLALSLVPFALWPLPPLVDLPFHYARFAIAHGGEDAVYWDRFFEHRWLLAANLGVDLLVAALAPLFGVKLATKLIVCAIPPLWVASGWWLSKEASGRVAPAFAVMLAFAFSLPVLWGFVNYALSVGLALAALALWIRWGRAGRLKLRAVTFLVIAPIIYIAHGYGWGVLGLGAFAFEWMRVRERAASDGAVATVLRAAVGTLPLWLPFVHAVGWALAAGTGVDGVAIEPNIARKLIALGTVFMDQWRWFDLALAGLVVALIIHATLSPAYRWRSRGMLLMAGLLALVFIAMPKVLFESAYADARMAPILLLAFLLAVDGVHDKARQRLAIAALLIGALKVLSVTSSSALWGQRIEAQRSLVADVEPGARVFTVHRPRACFTLWPLRRNMHVGGYHIAENAGFSNNMWDISRASPLTHREGVDRTTYDPFKVAWDEDCETRTPRFAREAIMALPREEWDYLWTIDQALPEGLQGFTLVRANEHGALYRIDR